MYYVYVLQSKKCNYMYIGCSGDLKKRIAQHNQGRNPATRKYAPFRLVYYEAFLDRKDATHREYKLKHYGSAFGHLKKRLRNSLSVQTNKKGGV